MIPKCKDPATCRVCILAAGDGEEPEEWCGCFDDCHFPRLKFEPTFFALTLCLLSPTVFTFSVVTFSSTIMECDQGEWSLWSKCFYNRSIEGAATEDPDNCSYYLEAPAFIHLARLGLTVLSLLRAGEILSLFILCHQKSVWIYNGKAILETLVGILVLLALYLFQDHYDTDTHFFGDEFSNCSLTDNLWVRLWAYVSLPCQTIITIGWILNAVIKVRKIYKEADQHISFARAVEKYARQHFDKLSNVIFYQTKDDTVKEDGVKIMSLP